MTVSFSTLGLSDRIVTQLESLGITEPTNIQEQAIPYLLDGKDVVGQSQTGTGKTAAFALPIVSSRSCLCSSASRLCETDAACVRVVTWLRPRIPKLV